MWIKLTMRNHAIGDGKILVNTDNVSCVITGQSILYEGETLVSFSGDREDCISVEESIDKVEEILGNGLRAGENYDRRERKQKEQPRSTASTAQSTAQSTNLIDCQAAIDALDCINGVEEVLRSLPSVQPESKTGKWIGTEFDGYADGNPVFYEWQCSECGCIFEDEEPTYKFCPNCGTKMTIKENEQ